MGTWGARAGPKRAARAFHDEDRAGRGPRPVADEVPEDAGPERKDPLDSTPMSYTPKCTSIKGHMVSIGWYLAVSEMVVGGCMGGAFFEL